MRLIDADELTETMWRSRVDSRECIENIIKNTKTVNAIPTVSQFKRMAIQLDYVPVVRCKDCKWFYSNDTQTCCTKHTGLALIREDAFCSYAERRKDE